MQYIGIIVAIGVWAYFEFYRIPKLFSTFTPLTYKLESNFNVFKRGTKEAIDEIWEKIDEFEQQRDVGTKLSPKVIPRN